MFKKNLTLIIFLLLSLYGCYTKVYSSKETNRINKSSMNTNEGNIFPHIIVEGTHVFHVGGATRESTPPSWETLEYCEWINPVYITPQSIKLKFSSFDQRPLQNMRIRVFGTLFVQTETYIAVDSIKVVK